MVEAEQNLAFRPDETTSGSMAATCHEVRQTRFLVLDTRKRIRGFHAPGPVRKPIGRRVT